MGRHRVIYSYLRTGIMEEKMEASYDLGFRLTEDGILNLHNSQSFSGRANKTLDPKTLKPETLSPGTLVFQLVPSCLAKPAIRHIGRSGMLLTS